MQEKELKIPELGSEPDEYNPGLDQDERFQEIMMSLNEKHGNAITQRELHTLAQEEFFHRYPIDAKDYGIRLSGK